MCVIFKPSMLVSQSCPILCPVDCSLPGSSIHGIFQARILKWVAISFSRGSSWPRDRTWVSCITGRLLTIWATKEALYLTIFTCFTNFISIYLCPFPFLEKLWWLLIIQFLNTDFTCRYVIHITYSTYHKTVKSENYSEIHDFFLRFVYNILVFICFILSFLQLWFWHKGFVAPWHVESCRTRDWTYVPCIGMWILNQWTSREILKYMIF